MHGALRIQRESELGTLSPLPVGAVVELSERDGTIRRYYSVGNTKSEIAALLSWTQGNVWLRESERSYMLAQRPVLFPDLEQAIAYLLQHPRSVHELDDDPDAFYFIVDAAVLQQAGLLGRVWRRTRFVDAIIELRAIREEPYLRVTHFSPEYKNRGGRQLWP